VEIIVPALMKPHINEDPALAVLDEIIRSCDFACGS
jgi:hypothetical protein